LLEEGGPKMWTAFMDELREIHLGAPAGMAPRSASGSISAKLQAAYEAVVAKRQHKPSAARRRRPTP
jgi:hypothetical protein